MATAALQTEIGWIEVSADNDAITRLFWRGVQPARLQSSPLVKEAVKQLGAYFDKRLTAFDLPARGVTLKLEVALPVSHRVYVAHLAPLSRGEVLWLLRDVTESKRAEASRRRDDDETRQRDGNPGGRARRYDCQPPPSAR